MASLFGFCDGRLSQKMDPRLQLMLKKVVVLSNVGVHIEPQNLADIPGLLAMI